MEFGVPRRALSIYMMMVSAPPACERVLIPRVTSHCGRSGFTRSQAVLEEPLSSICSRVMKSGSLNCLPPPAPGAAHDTSNVIRRGTIGARDRLIVSPCFLLGKSEGGGGASTAPPPPLTSSPLGYNAHHTLSVMDLVPGKLGLTSGSSDG